MCIGAGIWGTFVISAIALNLPMLLDIGNLIAFVPLMFAMLSFLIALHLRFFFRHRRAGVLLSSFVMTLGFSVVYGFALDTLCLGCQSAVNQLAFAALTVTGFVFSLTVLWFASRHRSAMETLAGSILIGGLASGVNIIGLKAFGVTGGTLALRALAIGSTVSPFYLALSLAAGVYVICCLALMIHYNQEFHQLPAPAARDLLQHKSS
jgi:hypothetical protein